MNKFNFDTGTVKISENMNVVKGMNDDCIELFYLNTPFDSNGNFDVSVAS